jgi:hypothetical protein
MQRLADMPCQMGIGCGNDHPSRCFGLVLDLDNSRQWIFGFETGLFIAGKPEHLISMPDDDLTGQQ